MAKHEIQEPTDEARARINRVIRSLAEDRVERGIDLSRPMHCNSCNQEKPAAGSALYGAYKLCNDCLLDFTMMLASGEAENVADYMTRRSDEGLSPSELSDPRDRPALGRSGLQPRDKLMPSNEPC